MVSVYQGYQDMGQIDIDMLFSGFLVCEEVNVCGSLVPKAQQRLSGLCNGNKEESVVITFIYEREECTSAQDVRLALDRVRGSLTGYSEGYCDLLPAFGMSGEPIVKSDRLFSWSYSYIEGSSISLTRLLFILRI